MTIRTCRFCKADLTDTMVDLGVSPLSNLYLNQESLSSAEIFYPLHVYVCAKCFLAQLEEFESPAVIFSDYAYFSSYSDTWLTHVKKYTDMIAERFSLTSDNLVVEIASNDGYLLQFFKEKGLQVLGIDPAANVADVAIKKGINTLIDFFGQKVAENLCANGIKADLLLGNNVLAHVPDINDFVAGMKIILNQNGIITMEFPHLLKLMKERQFDTIYHEHFSYLSFSTVKEIFAAHGLKVFDVEELSTHGGSLRIYACHKEDAMHPETINVTRLMQTETAAGLHDLATYQAFGEKVKWLKYDLLSLLLSLKTKGKVIVGYGAPAKGNTLLNYCGIRREFIDYTVDRSPYKQGKFLPGTHIPIFDVTKILETRPDYVFILPWNLKTEIIEQLSFIREWGGKFIVAIPSVEVL